jgi:hypothetical protein
MTRSFIAIAAMSIALLTAPLAQARGIIVDRFVHAASGYKVIVREDFQKTRVLEGVHRLTGETFTLVVTAKGKVTGDFQGKPVSFMVDKDGRPLADPVVVASN